jgi:hypothetical protein
MSYCHLRRGRTFDFPPAVQARIRSHLDAAACLALLCDPAAVDAGSCDDGDPCTTERCDAAAGCVHTPIPGCCDEATDCDDDNPCTADACNPSARCEHGVVADGAAACDDGNPCTTETCTAEPRCAYAPAAEGASCSVDACSPRLCSEGSCTAQPVPPDDTGLRCAVDALFAALGASPGETTRGARKRLRGVVERVGRRHAAFDAATTPRGKKRRLNALAAALRAVDRAIARGLRSQSMTVGLAERLRVALGHGRASVAGVRASLRTP